MDKNPDEVLDELDDRYSKIVEWLAENNLTPGDVLTDDDGREFVFMEEELGTAGEEGYSITQRKVYLDQILWRISKPRLLNERMPTKSGNRKMVVGLGTF